jgi:hypothetical protein
MKNRALTSEILKRVEEEQRVRKLQVSGKAKRSEYKKLDRQNTKWIKSVFAEFGWPTYSLIGKNAAEGIVLMVLHADQDIEFQKDALKLMRKLLKKSPNEISKARIAYLTDRILWNEGKPLWFGTLYDTKGTQVTVRKIKEPENVDNRRKEFGIKTTVEGRRKALVRELKQLGAK